MTSDKRDRLLAGEELRHTPPRTGRGIPSPGVGIQFRRYPSRDGSCHVCLLNDREHLLLVDSSDGEYPSGAVCLDCLRYLTESTGRAVEAGRG